MLSTLLRGTIYKGLYTGLLYRSLDYSSNSQALCLQVLLKARCGGDEERPLAHCPGTQQAESVRGVWGTFLFIFPRK